MMGQLVDLMPPNFAFVKLGSRLAFNGEITGTNVDKILGAKRSELWPECCKRCSIKIHKQQHVNDMPARNC